MGNILNMKSLLIIAVTAKAMTGDREKMCESRRICHITNQPMWINYCLRWECIVSIKFNILINLMNKKKRLLSLDDLSNIFALKSLWRARSYDCLSCLKCRGRLELLKSDVIGMMQFYWIWWCQRLMMDTKLVSIN
jgi:hypothetical protein